MSLEITVVGSNLDAGGNVKIALPNIAAFVGSIRMMSENDPGAVTGSPLLKSPETSQDYRLRVGVDSTWDDEIFNYTAQNYNKHKYTSSTLTMTWASGFLSTNGGSVTTAGIGAVLQTYRHFPLQGAASLCCEMSLALSNNPVSNWVLDFGLFLPSSATNIAVDGVYFRFNSAGLVGILNISSTETSTSVFTFTPVINQVYDYNIVVTFNEVEFWVDNVLLGRLPKPTSGVGTTFSGSFPFAIRHHHTGVTSAVIQAKLSRYAVSCMDIDNARPWAVNRVVAGLSGIQNPSGANAGITAQNANSAAAASATLSNTTSGYSTLGGRFQFAAVAGAETDYALFAFVTTIAVAAQTGRNLIVTGVTIDTYNTGAPVATTPTVLEWSIAVGATSVSLATVDAATTRLPKRLTLGVQSFAVGDAVGKQAQTINARFDSPLIVEPSCYLHIILRMPLGTATPSEIFRGLVGINSYWE